MKNTKLILFTIISLSLMTVGIAYASPYNIDLENTIITGYNEDSKITIEFSDKKTNLIFIRVYGFIKIKNRIF